MGVGCGMIKKLLSEASKEYFGYLRKVKAKSILTIEKEEYAIAKWEASLGPIKLPKIGLPEIREFASERAEDGVTNRTINLDVQALHNLLNHFRDPVSMDRLPTEVWPRLKHTTPLRELIPDDSIDRLVTAAKDSWISDYIKLLAYSGARKSAALKATWGDVDFERRIFTYCSKFDKVIHVNFNPRLDAHLRDMHTRALSQNPGVPRFGTFLFPGDHPCGHFVEPQSTFADVRTTAGLPEITLHDLRHYFASHAVMSGVDLLTVSKWLGHTNTDLVVKTYGHLNSAHLQAAATKMSFPA